MKSKSEFEEPVDLTEPETFAEELRLAIKKAHIAKTDTAQVFLRQVIDGIASDLQVQKAKTSRSEWEDLGDQNRVLIRQALVGAKVEVAERFDAIFFVKEVGSQ